MIPRRPRRALDALEIHFGSDLRLEQVEAVLSEVAGWPAGSVLVLQIVATEEGIRHLVRGPSQLLDAFRLLVTGLVPDARVEPVSPAVASDSWREGLRLSWSGSHPLLRSDGAAESAVAVLASLTELQFEERVSILLSLRPARPRRLPPPSRQDPPAALARLLFGSPPESHQLAQLRAKHAGPLLEASLGLAAAAKSEQRARFLLRRVASTFATRRGARGSFRARALRGAALQRSLEEGAPHGVVLATRELVPLTAWPVGGPSIAGLDLGAAPLRRPDRRIPLTGRVLAHSTWPAANQRPLAQPITGALSHTLVAGPTGTGKSELLAGLALADMRAGRGVLVVDGKGDLAQALLERIPDARVDDVIVLDPAGGGPIPGLRVFGDRADPELAADVVLGVMRDVFRDSWGVRSEQWLRTGLVTIAHDQTGTLGDLRFLFSDDRYRRSLVARLNDPMLKASWASFEAMSPGERTNQLGAPLTKLNELLGRRVTRAVLSQTAPGLDLHEALQRNRIVIASLSPGRLGGPAARLLAALLLHALFSAVQARSALPPNRRTPFVVYLDEPRALIDLPVPVDGLFEMARGLGVGLTISVQGLGVLPTGIREAVLTNARSVVAFQQSADDAERLARELSGISSEQLQQLGQYEMVARIAVGPGDNAAPATGRTLPLPPPSQDARHVRRRSAERYGRDPAAVDQALAQRHGQNEEQTIDGPIGRTRRKI